VREAIHVVGGFCLLCANVAILLLYGVIAADIFGFVFGEVPVPDLGPWVFWCLIIAVPFGTLGWVLYSVAGGDNDSQ